MSDYDETSWPDLTPDDYAAIDQLCTQNIEAGTKKGAASIQVEVEDSINKPVKKVSSENSGSPYELFRRRGYLSVTDLTAPAWCEVQFDYGLRQRRSLPVKERPKTFTSEKGKEIQVSTKVAEKNDKVTRGGKAIHKKLEKEVHKVEVIIPVQTLEESWALRLLDVLVRLSTLKDKGICRELSICGILQDVPILGIIDELRLEVKDLPKSPKRRKNEALSSSQTSIDRYFRKPEFVKPASPEERLVMKIVDSKTRQSTGIPSHADTLPSRLQVMLYRRLLGQFLNFNAALFLDFFKRLNIYPNRKFSDGFIGEMGVFVLDNELDLNFLDTTCLSEMLDTYSDSIKYFTRNVEISDSLSLVYRKRGRSRVHNLEPSGKTCESKPGRCPSPTHSSTGNEEIVKNSPLVSRPKRKRSSSSDSRISGEETVTCEGADKVQQRSANNIIGTKKFKYNETLLEEHLENVLLWWWGKREPRGVDIANVGRCNSCEYKEGCEWREQKALELSSEIRGALDILSTSEKV